MTFFIICKYLLSNGLNFKDSENNMFTGVPLVAGCDVNVVTAQHETPLYLASAKGATEIASHLMAQPGVDLCGARPSRVALHAASANGHVQVVRMLVSAGCNLNLVTTAPRGHRVNIRTKRSLCKPPEPRGVNLGTKRSQCRPRNQEVTV